MKVKGILPGLLTSLAIAIISQWIGAVSPSAGCGNHRDSTRNHVGGNTVSETTATWSGDEVRGK
jgi:hypothetical protein